MQDEGGDEIKEAAKPDDQQWASGASKIYELFSLCLE